MAKAKSTKAATKTPAVKKSSAKKSQAEKVEQPEVEAKPEVELTLEPEAPQPNVRFSSDTKFGDPPKRIRIGMKVIELPDADSQRAGFFSVHAKKLASTIKAYKLIQPKG